MLFTRTLSRFRYINKFKPLLDAYQGPYKDKFYYWTGLLLVIRAGLFGISTLGRTANIATSIIILSVIVGLHGMAQPFKSKYKNYQELVLFLNLQASYVILLCNYQDTTNTAAVDIIITGTTVHFSFIVIYHIIAYAQGGVIKSKIQLNINILTRWFTRLYDKPQPQQFRLQDSIRDNIPEVTFNYHEYREPLMGHDN